MINQVDVEAAVTAIKKRTAISVAMAGALVFALYLLLQFVPGTSVSAATSPDPSGLMLRQFASLGMGIALLGCGYAVLKAFFDIYRIREDVAQSR